MQLFLVSIALLGYAVADLDLMKASTKLYDSFDLCSTPFWGPTTSEKFLLDNISHKNTLANVYGLALAPTKFWRCSTIMSRIGTVVVGAVKQRPSIADSIALSLVEASSGSETSPQKIEDMTKIVNAKNGEEIVSAMMTNLEIYTKYQKLVHLHTIDAVGTAVQEGVEKWMVNLFKEKDVPGEINKLLSIDLSSEIEKALGSVNACQQKEGAAKAAGDVISFTSAFAPTIVKNIQVALQKTIKTSKCSEDVKSNAINHLNKFASEYGVGYFTNAMSKDQIINSWGIAYYIPKDFQKACEARRTALAMNLALNHLMYLMLEKQLDKTCNAVTVYIE
eukprot:TRINITY_DN50_c0_g1_i3.p1 TRINITY_DN50_c0_g1~~TRINITY_DN50_c0_g1_i3.p1  ORF type:complete len:335 (-),score=38.53 TRINITY_DN50_c0_g1_i3:1038-2042(-)